MPSTQLDQLDHAGLRLIEAVCYRRSILTVLRGTASAELELNIDMIGQLHLSAVLHEHLARSTRQCAQLAEALSERRILTEKSSQ